MQNGLIFARGWCRLTVGDLEKLECSSLPSRLQSWGRRAAEETLLFLALGIWR